MDDKDMTPSQPSDPMMDKGKTLSTADLAGRGSASERPAEPRSFASDESIILPDGTVAQAERQKSDQAAAPLFSTSESGQLHSRWDAIQAGFVDEPRKSVEDADALVATAIQRLAEIFADERAKLEREWGEGRDVSTEDLRVALRRYRSFFGRLLEV
jgi:hypothetical protein